MVSPESKALRRYGVDKKKYVLNEVQLLCRAYRVEQRTLHKYWVHRASAYVCWSFVTE